MKKKSNKENKKVIVRGYSLPRELVEWINQSAKNEGRSASGMLATILRKAKNDDSLPQ